MAHSKTARRKRRPYSELNRYGLAGSLQSRPNFIRNIILVVAALLAGGCARQSGAPAGELTLSGNIEVTDAQLGFKLPGRVAERLVAEGDRLVRGQLVARLDDAEQKEEITLRRAELAVVEAALAELEAGSRRQEIAAFEAALRSAEAERDRVRLDFTRSKELRGKEAISDRDFESAQAQLKVAEARAAEAAERLKLIKEGPRAETIRQARARTDQARAVLALAEIRLENTKLLSPLTGVVLSHHIEPGEYVSVGTPVATVADTAHVWVRAYVNQTDLGRIRLGQKVAVRTDTFPDRTYEGVIGFISAEAEFTPKTVQTPKERVKLVFRLKVDVANTKDELKPGMPADVIAKE